MYRLWQVALAVHIPPAAPYLLVLHHAEVLLPREEVEMYARVIALAVAILAHPFPSLANELGCSDDYQIPREILKEVAKQTSVIVEIREQDPQGYIHSLFYNRVYMEGLFFQKGEGITVCSITFVIEFDPEGKLLFIWQPNEKGV